MHYKSDLFPRQTLVRDSSRLRTTALKIWPTGSEAFVTEDLRCGAKTGRYCALCTNCTVHTNFDTRLCEPHSYVSHYLPRGRSHFLKYLTVFTKQIRLKPCSIFHFHMPFSYKHSFKFLPSETINFYSNDKNMEQQSIRITLNSKTAIFFGKGRNFLNSVINDI